MASYKKNYLRQVGAWSRVQGEERPYQGPEMGKDWWVMNEKDTVSVLLNSTMMDAQKHKSCVLGMIMTCVNANLDYYNRAHWEDFLN